ncbi:hypothetical protein K8352_01775 [Flavobacteriaceae bacterium F89]|uniref:DUF4878 domain-containing protein n=1 Tax=Cerina litoralis TaxID=2874477 RepID=A0AAE3ETT3_9FLAO|nr:hypothetical protein [Cerina litoralis]MCG2459471.1 hypothetical protein [Cerina litoralis]
MKRMVIYSLVLLFFACTEQQQLSPTETAKVVAESFYQKDNATLKKHTTPEGYDGMIAIQNFVGNDNPENSDFEVLDETTDGDISWVKFTTSYDNSPETFKLVKQDGRWKVTQQGVREKGPF